jgi:hypothetical protein
MSALVEKAALGPRGYPVLGLLHKAWKTPPQFFLDAAIQYGEVVSLSAPTLNAHNHLHGHS